MKSIALSIAIFAIALTCAGTAHAQTNSLRARTAGDLAEMCTANPRQPGGAERLNFCDGFAQGAVDVELRHAGATKPFCMPPGTKREVTMHEFGNWVRAVPSRASDDAPVGLFRFFAERFPCK
jgi:Rap1a immunity proteins